MEMAFIRRVRKKQKEVSDEGVKKSPTTKSEQEEEPSPHNGKSFEQIMEAFGTKYS